MRGFYLSLFSFLSSLLNHRAFLGNQLQPPVTVAQGVDGLFTFSALCAWFDSNSLWTHNNTQIAPGTMEIHFLYFFYDGRWEGSLRSHWPESHNWVWLVFVSMAAVTDGGEWEWGKSGEREREGRKGGREDSKEGVVEIIATSSCKPK